MNKTVLLRRSSAHSRVRGARDLVEVSVISEEGDKLRVMMTGNSTPVEINKSDTVAHPLGPVGHDPEKVIGSALPGGRSLSAYLSR
jgi:hypothetical protein